MSLQKETAPAPAAVRISPHAALFVGILAVSSASILIRLAQAEASSLAIAAYRLGFATLILLPFAWRRRGELRTLAPGRWGMLALAGIFLALHFAAWITSLGMTSVVSSVVLVTTTPLWVGLFSPLLLRERISRPMAWGLMIALAGGVLVALSDGCAIQSSAWNVYEVQCSAALWSSDRAGMLGNALALLGALMAAAYLLVGRRQRASLSLISYITIVYGAAALTLLAMAIVSRQPMGGYSPATWLVLVALALIPQLLGHSSFNYSLAFLSAAFVSVALLGEPIGSTLLAMALLKEVPTLLEAIGAVVILVGIFIATRESH